MKRILVELQSSSWESQLSVCEETQLHASSLTFSYPTLRDVMTTEALTHVTARILKPGVHTLFLLRVQFL